ncbi:MAG: transglutaminase family protein [Bacteroidota bacterium]
MLNLEPEIQSILKLLDDSDEIYASVAKELIRRGSTVVPTLRFIIANGNKLEAERAQEVLEAIAFELSERRLREVFEEKDNKPDLEKAALAIALAAYPELDPRPYSELLDLLAFELDSHIDSTTALSEIPLIFGKYIAVEKQFKVNRESFYDPDNNYLNKVLERRKGSPVSIACLYLLVGDRLNLPVEGIALPSHFLVRLKLDGKELYLDPYEEGGRALSRKECYERFPRFGGQAANFGAKSHVSDFFVPVGREEILIRMLNNLISAYSYSGESRRWRNYVKHFQRLRAVVELALGRHK